MNIKKNILLLSCILLISSTLQAQQKFSLEEAIRYALDHNLQIKQAMLTQKFDNENLSQSKVNLLPDINGQVNQSNNYGRTINPTTNTYTNSNTHYLQGLINGQLLLFGGLQKLTIIKQNKYQLLSDNNRVEKASNDAILNVLTFYLQILSFQDLVVSSKQKADVSQLQIDNDQKKLDVGNITEADLLQDKAQYAQDVESITTYQNNLDIARTSLLQYMNLDPSQTLEVERPDSVTINGLRTDYNTVDVYQKAKELMPDVKAEEYASSASQQALNVARSAYYPSLTLNTSIGTVFSPSYKNYYQFATGQFAPTPFITQTTNERVLQPIFTSSSSTQAFQEQIKNNLTTYFGFSLNIPIFNGWQTRIQVRKAKIQYEQQLLVTEIARSNLNKTIVQAVIDLRAADKRFQADYSSEESLKKAFYFSQQRYNVGLLNSLDFNLAKSKFTIAEATEIQDKYDLIFRAKVIDFYLGKKITLNP